MSETTLPPERVAELAEHSIVGAEMPPQGMGQTIPELIVTCLTCGHMRAGEYTDHLAPLIGGWLAEAEARVRESQDHADKTWRRARAAEMDAAEVRVRMEALVDEWERENAWGLGEQLASATRAALVTEREEGERGHRCDSGNFDRTICPEPCGRMHSYCDICGERQDRCAHEEGGR